MADKDKKKLPKPAVEAFHSRNPTEERRTIGNIGEDIQHDPNSGFVDKNGLEELQVKKKENVVLYAVDKDLDCLVIIINGLQGEQHKIFQFTVENCE